MSRHLSWITQYSEVDLLHVFGYNIMRNCFIIYRNKRLFGPLKKLDRVSHYYARKRKQRFYLLWEPEFQNDVLFTCSISHEKEIRIILPSD